MAEAKPIEPSAEKPASDTDEQFDNDISNITPEMFEGFLKNPVENSQIQLHEKQYLKEMGEEKLSHVSHFLYALCLIRSRYNADIHRGILLMEDLSLGNPQGNREYYFFLSLGYARLKHYSVALQFVKSFLKAEPENERIRLWEDFLKKKMKKEATMGVALATGSALVLGGILGIGLSLLRLKR